MIKALIFLLVIFIIFSLYSLSKRLGKKTAMISFVLFFLFLVSLTSKFIFIKNDKSEKNYFPPKFDGEKIIPGYFNEKN